MGSVSSVASPMVAEVRPGPVAVEEFFEEQKARLKLTLLAGKSGLSKKITRNGIDRPGLALAGFTQRFAYDRVQILGETEITFLESLGSVERVRSVQSVVAFDIPCIAVSKSLAPPVDLVAGADVAGVPLLSSALTTVELVRGVCEYLDDRFAPRTTVHGSLVDVYGVGLLFTGKSCIGKSETALDLVERGHRLVADDVVTIARRGTGILIGTGNSLLRRHMEIRGIGIIDVQSVFGIRAIRLKKRIEVEVRLVKWEESVAHDRTGLEEETTAILGVEIPFVTLPIVPGKNITVIAEVIALHYLLRLHGINPAQQLDERLIELMKGTRAPSKYLRDDYE